MRGRIGWATGKTAATDERIARGVEKRRGVPRGMYRRHREALGIGVDAPQGAQFVGEEQWHAYAYLLGMYLGDGYLAGLPRSCRLEISLDAKYPALVDSCEGVMRLVWPGHNVARLERTGCVVLYSYGWRWLALFPHHGPGRKHERKIALLDWQRAIVDMCPVDFLGGLVDSDGCRSVRHQDGKDYPFYSFDNRSLDILSLFCETCDKLGVHYSRPKVQTVSVARRADVAYLDSVLARKS